MLKRFLKETKEYSFLIGYMAKTGLKAEVANSYLNWIWWVLEPLASMLVYYVIFVNILGRNQPYYIVYIYMGTLTWSYFDRCMLFAVSAIRINRDIVTKTYVPKHVLLLSNLVFNSIKMLISIGILAVLILLNKVPLSINVLWVIPLIMLLQLITFGIGLIALHFGVFVDDLVHAMNIILRIVFYMTGVFYDLKMMLPEPWGDILIKVNPLAMIIYNIRTCALYGSVPDLKIFAVWLIIALMLCIAGLRLCYKYENTYVKII